MNVIVLFPENPLNSAFIAEYAFFSKDDINAERQLWIEEFIIGNCQSFQTGKHFFAFSIRTTV